MKDYLPKEWTDISGFARKDFIRSNPGDLKRRVKALNQATKYIEQNRAWALKNMKSGLGYSDKAAEITYRTLKFVPGGRINKKAVENARNFLIEYRILKKKEKAPDVDKLFTNQLTQVR